MTNLIPGNDNRSIFVATGGNDDRSGENSTFAMQTISAALTAINELVPPPSEEAPSSIIISGSGLFQAEGLVFPEGCQFSAPSAVLIAQSSSFAVQPAAGAVFNFGSVLNLTEDGVGILLDSSVRSGVFGNFVSATGSAASIGIHIKGTSEDIAVDVGQVDVLIGRGVLDESTVIDPSTVQVRRITLTGDNTCGYCADLGTGTTITTFGTIINQAGTNGTIGVELISGQLSINTPLISAATSLIARGSSILTAVVPQMSGEITLEAGAMLNIECREFADIHPTTGIINGYLGGERYGNSLVDTLDTITTETDTAKVLKPDGSGGVTWEADGGVPAIQVTEVAADYTVLITDDVVVGAAAGINILLPPLSTVFKQVNIKCMLFLGATMDITGDSGETIEGQSSLFIASNSAVTLIPTSTGWMII